MGFTAIVDTREKEPWSLASASIDATLVEKLDTGDYSIQGLESILCIERKRSVSEVAMNLSEVRFKNELNRMLTYKYRFLVLEFNIQDILDYPVGSAIPRAKWKILKIKGPYIMMCLSQFQVKYGIHVIFAGNSANAEYLVTNIMKRVYDQELLANPQASA